jgi:hypothetical protein
MNSAFLSVFRRCHDVELEVSPDDPTVGYVIEDVPEFDDAGQKRIGTLYRKDDRIELTEGEQEEAEERLIATNRFEPDCDCEPYCRMSDREIDRISNDYFYAR